MTNVAAIIVLAFVAMVAFSEQVSAYKTTITTTVEDNALLVALDGLDNGFHGTFDGLDNGFHGTFDGLDNPSGSTYQCRRQIQGQQLNHCQMHISQQGRSLVENPRQQQQLQMCCNQLRQVEEECQCEAIQKVVQQTLEQQQQGGRRGAQGIQQPTDFGEGSDDPQPMQPGNPAALQNPNPNP